jgi:hypothetical protein
MSRWSRVRGPLSGVLVLVALGCEDDPSGGNQNIANAEVFEAKAKESFVPIIDGINDGLARLLVALGGGPADGVVITPFTGGANAQIQVDFDGNGSREGAINGGLVGDVSTGAAVTINSVTGDDETMTASGGLTATETSPGVILLDNMAGSGDTDPPGSQNAAEVEITDGAVTLDIVAGVPNGFIDLEVTGEGETLSIAITFTPDGLGGFIVHFSGDGLDFTIP